MGTRDKRRVSPPTPSSTEETPSNTVDSRRRADDRRASECHADPPPATLAEAIEAEREYLLELQAMTLCLYEVLLYSDDDDGAMHADVAQVIARLLRDVVSRLETIKDKLEQSAA